MNKDVIAAFEAGKETLRKRFNAKLPCRYSSIVTAIASVLEDNGINIDADRVHEIDDGDYQGTLVYVIGARGYQPSDYWYVRIWYGSCSGCDTLEAALDNNSVNDIMTLCLHVAQGLKRMGGDIAGGDGDGDEWAKDAKIEYLEARITMLERIIAGERIAVCYK